MVMLESPKEGALRLVLPQETCILSQQRPAAAGLGPVLGGLGCGIQEPVFTRLGSSGFSGTELTFHLHPWCVSLLTHLLLFLNSVGERREVVYWFPTTPESLESTWHRVTVVPVAMVLEEWSRESDP